MSELEKTTGTAGGVKATLRASQAPGHTAPPRHWLWAGVRQSNIEEYAARSADGLPIFDEPATGQDSEDVLGGERARQILMTGEKVVGILARALLLARHGRIEPGRLAALRPRESPLLSAIRGVCVATNCPKPAPADDRLCAKHRWRWFESKKAARVRWTPLQYEAIMGGKKNALEWAVARALDELAALARAAKTAEDRIEVGRRAASAILSTAMIAADAIVPLSDFLFLLEDPATAEPPTLPEAEERPAETEQEYADE